MNALDVFLDLPWDKQEEVLRIHQRRKIVRDEADKIKQKRRELAEAEAALQQHCKHPAGKKTHRREDGWDAKPEFFTDFYCPDCDRRWTHPGSL